MTQDSGISDVGAETVNEDVLVTGGAGFIGSHTLDYLVQKYPDCKFTCVDKLSYATNYLENNLRKVSGCDNFTFIKLDLAEEHQRLDELINHSANNFTTIINFAAESCVDKSFNDPLYFTKNNVLATQNLLECCRTLLNSKPNLRRNFKFIHISTDEVYGEQKEGEIIDEDGPLHPTNPYAASKAACDLIIEAYKHSYKIPITLIRSNNVYGPRQFPEKIIPACLKALQKASPTGIAEKERIPIHGNGRHTRRYLHVLDFAKAVDHIWNWLKNTSESSSDFLGETFNVGTDDEVDNLSMVKLICTIFMRKKFGVESLDASSFIRHTKDRNYNDFRYSIDFTKIKKVGWKQEISLEQGIEELVKAEIENEK
ncbi:hypothetical protein QFC19_006873 [Naganishia cerealis]|uniref:Uncharacterized protein n=1 Tax=Naganishia cerealis TaxID=610337 RepID=A0ACC2VDF0_9TREE|nr:hypothetical protein QFC19_006873 [Naganishia cerealis]